MISMSQRLMAIIQLCFAFSLALSYLVQPFMGEYFSLRSRMLLYEYIMGTSEFFKTQPNGDSKVKRQIDRFQALPLEEQQEIKKNYLQLQNYTTRPAIQKIFDGIHTLTRDIPPFEQAWIFFSILISILILLRKEGAATAAWILPLIVLAYSIDNQMTGKPQATSLDFFLFPNETDIAFYIPKEFHSLSILDQKKQLEIGWQNYLIDHWSIHPNPKETALEEGEFQFTLARLKVLHSQPQLEWLHSFHEKSHPLFLLIFMGWNLGFAWVVNKN